MDSCLHPLRTPPVGGPAVVLFDAWLAACLEAVDGVWNDYESAALAVSMGEPMSLYEARLTDLRGDMLLGIMNTSCVESTCVVKTRPSVCDADEASSARIDHVHVEPGGVVAPIDSRYPLTLMPCADEVRLALPEDNSAGLRGLFCVFKPEVLMSVSAAAMATRKSSAKCVVSLLDMRRWLEEIRRGLPSCRARND